MTIKEFAKLCGCNPQTLRYYDRVGLLKPVRIKNLQSALFTKEQLEAIRQKVTKSMRIRPKRAVRYRRRTVCADNR